MAIFNELLSARFSRALQKLFSMKGPQAVRQLSGEVMPVIPFFFGNENRWLEGWNLFGQVTSVAAVAAQNSAIRLRNPINSNVVAVITKILLASWTVADPALFLQQTQLSTDLAGVFAIAGAGMDNRMSPTNPNGRTPVLILSGTQNVASIGSTKLQASIAINSDFDLLNTTVQEMPVLPGDVVQLSSSVVNVGITASWFWRERALEESERSIIT